MSSLNSSPCRLSGVGVARRRDIPLLTRNRISADLLPAQRPHGYLRSVCRRPRRSRIFARHFPISVLAALSLRFQPCCARRVPADHGDLHIEAVRVPMAFHAFEPPFFAAVSLDSPRINSANLPIPAPCTVMARNDATSSESRQIRIRREADLPRFRCFVVWNRCW